MQGDKKDLIQYRLNKAKEDLNSSESMLRNNYFAQSLNRSYYAIFHSARSLLATVDLDSKKHSGIISLFIFLASLGSTSNFIFKKLHN